LIEKVLILPDVHLTQKGYAKPYELVKKFMKSYKPHKTVLLGDFMDCEAISHWNENKRLTMEGIRWEKELEVANRELDYIQEYSGHVIYLEGNHEDWTGVYTEKNPGMGGFVDIPKNLNIFKRGMEWVKYGDLYEIGKMIFVHGLYISIYHAKKHLLAIGDHVCYGHAHNAQTHQLNMRRQDPYMAYGLGCLCDHAPAYMKNKHANWMNQFAIMEWNTKMGNFNLTPINITDNQFIYGGKQYK